MTTLNEFQQRLLRLAHLTLMPDKNRTFESEAERVGHQIFFKEKQILNLLQGIQLARKILTDANAQEGFLAGLKEFFQDLLDDRTEILVVWSMYLSDLQDGKRITPISQKELCEDVALFYVDKWRWQIQAQHWKHDDRTQEISVDILLKDVRELSLTVHAQNILESKYSYESPIRFVGQLVQMHEAELLKRRGCGRKTLWEIKKTLEERGLKLGTVLSPEAKAAIQNAIL